MRLIPPPGGRIEAGEALLDGEDMLKMSEERVLEVRGAKIAMIFQEPMTSLNPVLTIRAPVDGGARDAPWHEQGASFDPVQASCLKMVGIPDGRNRLSDYPHQFSGGMRQRVMIAMGLSCEPAPC